MTGTTSSSTSPTPGHARGRVFDRNSPARSMNRVSTDMGNVARVVPAIHPCIGIDSSRR
ncbi:hypothetical protein GCM10022223_50930 [Kineosporia mesophila]|uniref:Uncharacterized protein n=1 Tax=Kineosporia mesophila TaxID=566012 RepID=A0ABP7A9K9_9ACTN